MLCHNEVLFFFPVQKLLERTRARRENLQKKMAERSTASNRQMAKRAREPLAETCNSLVTEPVVDKGPQHSTKHSPSKRSRSGELDKPTIIGEENREPAMPPQPMVVPTSTVLQRNREEQREAPTSSTPAAMKSRLARLAEQRHYWDSEGKEQAVAPVPTPVHAAASSEAPVGRKGRLANLAATIGSWEDDLSHAAPRSSRDNAQEKPGSVSNATPAWRREQPVHSPVKSTRAFPPSPQKTEVPEARPALRTGRGLPSPVSNPQRSYQGRASAFTPSPEKGALSSASPVPQSPLKNQALFRAMEINGSPEKPELPTQPSTIGPTGPSVLQTRERFTKETTPATPLQQRGTAGATGPSVLQTRERFTKETTLATPLQQRGTAGATGPSVLQTRERFTKETTPATPLQQRGTAGATGTPGERELALNLALLCFLHEEESHEMEMKVDPSNNSEINNFDGFHDQIEELSGEEGEGEEEEDKLNISSMSILAPFSESVAAVIKSPVRKMMTSTPASSFNAKSQTPDIVSRPSKFQRARLLRAGSSDSLETDEHEDHNLPYSIDAYRSTRIKESTERPCVKQVIVKEDVSRRAAEEPRSQGHTSIKQKMKVLTYEMNLQQTVISQASQALNCCTDEEHGKGSHVEAEAERLLLIATEKRGALKAELDRLKGEGPSSHRRGQGGDMGVSASKGSISLLELRLPLKADFVCSAASKPECSSHYFFIMIRAGAENTVATPLASTSSAISGDAITFSTKFTMPDVSNDFAIDIEVYCLVQKRELNPDKRKKPSKSKAITPKRFLSVMVASPGGPNTVRTSNFVLVGSHKLTLASIGKNKFLLEKVPFLCPMEGHIYLKMQCEVGSLVEERGFLTMFEDVSGFGAWHRRWCVLSGYCISYWTYPDDEKRKNPMGRINLANCISRKVEPANREFCARPNTFELITVRPQRENDRETLVSQCKNTMCVTKNWLCADTKDERNLWMQKLNQILVDLRMWQPDSCHRPV
uniref:Anillin n=1 Tax=Oncorhynchus kisutch TaxID=8019 RepID=A0A8C7G547_ONCKI